MMNRFFILLLAASCLTAVGQTELIPDTAEFNFFECDSLQWNQMTFFDDTTVYHLTPCGEFYEYISEVEQELDVNLLDLMQEGNYSGTNIASNENSSMLWGEYFEDFNDGEAQGWSWLAEIYINGQPMGGASFTGGSFYVSSCCDSGGNQHVKVTSPNFQASTGYFIESVSFSGGASASGNDPPTTWGVSRIRINNGGWQEFSGQPVIPEGTHTVRLEFEALGSWNASVNLDNIHVVATNSVLGLPHTPELLSSCNAKVEQLNLTIQNEGCSDNEACNYVASDVCTNSCVYPVINNDCDAGEIACGIGTKWNPELQECEVFRPTDTNFDGCVQLNDMLNLLSDYGLCFCDGEYDECGVCNGSGPSIPIIESIEILYDSVYAEQIDEWFVFEVGADTTYQYVCGFGCTDPLAENYNESVDTDDGSCFYPWACGDPLEYQGYDYETVQIGEQCWFAENLRAENYLNGEAITSVIDQPDYNSLWLNTSANEEGALNVYPQYESNGMVYNWYAVADDNGLCPEGWSVPSKSNYESLVEYAELVYADDFVSSLVDDTQGLGTNETGYSATTTGYVDGQNGLVYAPTGQFQYMWFWTSTLGPYPDAWSWRINTSFGNPINQGTTNQLKSRGLAVRCIKD